MLAAEKEIAFSQMCRTLEGIATHVENVGKSLDYVAANIDEDNLFPTIKSVREEIRDSVNDLKNAISQLINADAELQSMENEPNQ